MKRVTIESVSSQTLAETLYKLSTKHRATAVRNTGFGKTFMLAELAQRYGRVLYVYPLNIIKNQVKKEYNHKVKGATFMSYMALASKIGNSEDANMQEAIKQLEEFKDIKLFIFDEMHMMGANKTRIAVKNLIGAFPKTDRVGVTATINRTDGFDFIGEFFGYDSLISPYSLKDAIEDGVMQKPYYVKAHYDVLQQNKKNIKAINKLVNLNKLDRKTVEKISSQLHRMSECINMDEVIRESIYKCYKKEPDYMKFIIFFQDRKIIEDKKEEVINWFKKAFPNKQINSLRITSDTAEYRNNLELVDELEETNGVVDLILCIDMLNMGYHVDNVTGVVLMRSTKSNIVYKQQIGRCMSITRLDRPIVFDLVNNIDAEACVLSDDNTSKTEGNLGGNANVNRLDKSCIEMHDLTVGLKEFYERVEELSVRDRVDKAVNLYVNYSMPFGSCFKLCQVRPKYLERRIIELIKSGELTKIVTVGDSTEVIKCNDFTIEMIKKDYNDSKKAGYELGQSLTGISIGEK